MHTGRILEQRQELLDPAKNGAAIDDKVSFGELLDDIGIAQPVEDIPAHGQGSHVVGEVVVGERTG